MVGKLVDAAADLSPDLTGRTERIFVVHQKVGQIGVPEISLEAIGACQIHQAVNALIVKTAKIFLVVVFAARVVKDPSHVLEDLSVFKITVYDQFMYPCHSFFQTPLVVFSNCPGSAYYLLPRGCLGARFSRRRRLNFPQNR
jgi:hypothetical protein